MARTNGESGLSHLPRHEEVPIGSYTPGTFGGFRLEKSLRLETLVNLVILLGGLVFATVTLYNKTEDAIQKTATLETQVVKLTDDIVAMKIQESKIEGVLEGLRAEVERQAVRGERNGDPPRRVSAPKKEITR